MSTVTNPLAGLIEGLLQGHALGQQMHRQAQEDQAFQTNQALHNQQMSVQDIMNRQMLERSARPVSAAGTVENPAVQGPESQSPVPGLPDQKMAGMGAFIRKADPSRTVKYGGQQYELHTPEEQQRRDLDQQISGQNALFDAQDRNELQRQMNHRRNTMILEHGPTYARGLGRLGIPDGTPLTRDENIQYTEKLHSLIKGGIEKVGADDTLINLFPDQGQGGGEEEGPPMPGIQTPARKSGLPPQYQKFLRGVPGTQNVPAMDTTGEPAAGQSAAAAPQPGGPQVLRQGGTQFTGDFGKFIRAYAMKKGTSMDKLSADQILEARGQFEGAGKALTEEQLIARARAGDKESQGILDDLQARKLKIAAATRSINTFTPPANQSGKATIDQVPAEFRDEVKQILEYGKPLPSSSQRNPRNQQLNYWVSRVGAADPASGDLGYNAGEYGNRNKLMSSIKSGEISNSVVALNTMIGHAGTMWNAIDKLDNSWARKYNTFANFLNRERGSDQARPFEIARLGVSEELAKLLKGGVATKDEVDHWMDIFDKSDSNQALKTAVKTIFELAEERIKNVEDKASEGMGRSFAGQFIRPRSKAILDKIMGANGGGQQGGGGSHVIEVNGKHYQYKGTGATDDLKNYTEVK